METIMETIDELIPLTAEDLKKLEAYKKDYSSLGCAIFMLFLVVILAAGAWLFYGSYNGLTYIFIAVGLLILALSLLIIKFVPNDNKKVLQDIAEGKKRRIVAPVESKDLVEGRRSSRRFGGSPVTGIAMQLARDSVPLNLKYSMTIKGIKFPLSENDYLSRFRKGTFVKFEIAPNSQTILSPPTEASA